MIDENRKKNAEAILNYWELLSFLNQENISFFKDSSEKKYKNPVSWKTVQWKTRIDDQKDLKDALLEATEKTGLPYRGKITVSFGRIRRDRCTAVLAERLNDTDSLDQKEIGNSEIALMTMQLEADGTYHKDSHSFSVSPVLWVTGRCAQKNIPVENLVSVQKYRNDVRKLEELFDDDDDTEEEVTEEKEESSVSDACVTFAQLQKVSEQILKQCNVNEIHYEESCSISFCLYKDKKAAEQENNEFIPMGTDFFSESLDEIRNRIQKKDFGSHPMDQSLLDYIDAPLREKMNEGSSDHRLDVVRPSSFAEYQKYMDTILDIRKSPVGKWPSRYQPALMQQVAINEVSSFYENDQKNIFSVNGPPGTGKTTMLKQIVADYMVKRAELLAEYKDPDDAFDKHSFKDGILTNGGYNQYINGYYTLKNDHINDYGILVASYNNGAVANIAVEFPELKGIQSDLKTSSKDDEKAVQSLQEIRDLFDPDRSDETVIIKKGKEKKEEKDVYFSAYETSLLHKQKVHEDSWGAISARLGSRKYVNEYCMNYLEPLLWGELGPIRKTSDDYQEKMRIWHQAAEQFQQQLQKVKNMQDEISKDCDQIRSLHDENNELNEKLKVRKPEIETALKELENSRKDAETKLPSAEKDYEAVDKKVNRLQKESLDPLKAVVVEKQKIHNAALSEYNAVKEQHEKCFSVCEDLKKQINDSHTLIAEKKNEIQELQKETGSVQKLIETKKEVVTECQNLLLQTEKQMKKRTAMVDGLTVQLNEQNAKYEQLMSLGFFQRHKHENKEQITQTEAEIERLQGEIARYEKLLDHSKKEYDQKQNDLRNASIDLTSTRNRIPAIQNRIESNRKKIKKAEQDIPVCNEKLKQQQIQLNSILTNLDEKHVPVEKAEKDLADAEQKYQECLQEINPYLEYRKDTEETLQKLRLEIQKDEQRTASLTKELSDIQAGISRNLEKQKAITERFKAEGIVVPDTDFLRKAVSKDNAVSVKPQTADPWLGASYDREREKLFRYALKVNKYFLETSVHVRDNLRNFYAMEEGHYTGGERIRFSERDLENCTGALFQTLFLLTPVISTTFASAGRLLKYVKPHQLGLLIIDEAGQSEPQCALKTLSCCRKALIVGDPRQIEPVVSDDMKLLKKSFHGDIYDVYKNPGNSVQSNADLLNPIGSWSGNTWTGSPLLVHRRCISPMFDIANEISYGGTMKQQTAEPSEQKKKTFAGHGSRWYQVSGREEKTGHGVPQQNAKAVEILEDAFTKAGGKEPSIFVISPFRSVVHSFSVYLGKYMKENPESPLHNCKDPDGWLKYHAGTIHTFQGKEADQVTFLLGCDRNTKPGTVSFVSPNIVNVAVTRAKYRLFAIGDMKVWENNRYVSTMIRELYLYSWAKLHDLKEDDPKYKQKALELIDSLPDEESFDITEETDPEGNTDYVIHAPAEKLVDNRFLTELTDENLHTVGLDKKTVDHWNPSVKLGLRTYFTLKPVMEKADLPSEELMAVEPGILFCLGLEAQLKDCLTDFLKESDPDMELNVNHRNLTLSECDSDEMTIGTYSYVLKKGKKEIVQNAVRKGHPGFDQKWWSAFQTQLWLLTHYRNDCCHYSRDHEHNGTGFDWKHLQEMMKLLFVSGENGQYRGTDTGIMQACDSVKEEL